jgi:hypothetical protein
MSETMIGENCCEDCGSEFIAIGDEIYCGVCDTADCEMPNNGGLDWSKCETKTCEKWLAPWFPFDVCPKCWKKENDQ